MTKPIRTTPKQEKFCHAYIETGNAAEAYRQSYNTESMKPQTIHREAKALLDTHTISTRLEQIRGTHMERHVITVDKLLEELEEARRAALEAESPQSSAAVSATMGKAKLLGLDKQIIDHQSSDGSMTPKPSRIELVAAEPNDNGSD